MNIWLLLWVAFLIAGFCYSYYQIAKFDSIKSNYGKPVKGKVVHLDRDKKEIVVEAKLKNKRIHVAMAFKFGSLSSSRHEIERIFSNTSDFRNVYLNKLDLRLSSLTDPRGIVSFKHYLYCVILFCLFIFTLWVLV